LTRHKIPNPSGATPTAEIAKGAYVLVPADNPDVVLVATGSEVHVAEQAAAALGALGKKVRVVSAPCIDLFLERPRAEQDALLGAGTRRVAIEAGRTRGWEAVVGRDGLCIGVDGFGASAPYTDLAREYGLSTDKVVARIQSFLEQGP
ncbi:MAG TPA: transketolase C-terminal domain-containing protein, partial [Polyangiaceae bacterium]|nr:transketolase C-terminal domain-containing protein [Polyangiaceae bacterium]